MVMLKRAVRHNHHKYAGEQRRCIRGHYSSVRLRHVQTARCYDRLPAAAASSQPARLPQLFVPDITLDPGNDVPEAVFLRLKAEAAAMPLWELTLRTALEMGVLVLAWQFTLGVIRALSRRGEQVSKDGAYT